MVSLGYLILKKINFDVTEERLMLIKLLVMILAFPVLTVLFLAGLVVFGGR